LIEKLLSFFKAFLSLWDVCFFGSSGRGKNRRTFRVIGYRKAVDRFVIAEPISCIVKRSALVAKLYRDIPMRAIGFIERWCEIERSPRRTASAILYGHATRISITKANYAILVRNASSRRCARAARPTRITCAVISSVYYHMSIAVIGAGHTIIVNRQLHLASLR
jgi:hypothetical protein